jgi:hypothetical protein
MHNRPTLRLRRAHAAGWAPTRARRSPESQWHAAAAVYCPDKKSLQHDLAAASAAVKRALADVNAKRKSLAAAKKTHNAAKIAASQRALAAAQARLAAARSSRSDAQAALSGCD